MTTKRQQAIAKYLTLTIPRVPFFDAEAIREAAGARRMKDLPPATALWLATIAYIRHAHTDYDTLLDEGYGRDAARFFVVDAINETLDRWGATRRLEPEPDEESGESEPDASGD
ncbi:MULTISPECIES: DUF2293 domain-containing protein [unclassified Aureimonas]|uniref:DUF2293 domain-containing protein n=1 Tax=unclassified Aureimonas TaxID=2615206 RepID=UPI0006F92066|nr:MULTISPECIES: DUF2293 domain-containing protein [unclassified Aureimonas]KQT52811.1 hypothetical protein ASG62_12860 [Aureimonas sp. Leaf427]KQT80271.1 hypothetical protein ASG54_06710 [Aureimonas sp. Leaf460]